MEIDTRKLVRSIRNLASRKALITDADTPLQDGLFKPGIPAIYQRMRWNLVSRKKIPAIPGSWINDTV